MRYFSDDDAVAVVAISGTVLPQAAADRSISAARAVAMIRFIVYPPFIKYI
jgi:hypothetical protein